MPGSDVDLRDLPRYFWLGLGLEFAGGAIIVASASAAARIAGGCVFVAGLALAAAAYLLRRERGEGGDTGAAREGKSRRGARTVGVLLVCAGAFGVAVSALGGGRFEGVLAGAIAIALGVMHLGDPGLPSRRFAATGPESPLVVRLGVHVKHFLAIAVGALLILLGAFFCPEAGAATAERLWWWVFMGLAAFFAVHCLGGYVWQCWIRRDYKEPEFIFGS